MAMTVILLLSGSAIWLLYTQNLRRSIDTLLFVQYENIRNGIDGAGTGNEAIDFQNETFSKINAVKNIGLMVVILDAQGKIVEQSSGAAAQLPAHDGYADAKTSSGSSRLFRGKVGAYTIIVSQNLDAYERATESLLLVLFLVFGTAVLCSFAVSAFFAGRAIAPLRVLRSKVRSIDPARLTGSPLMSAYPDDEIGHLAGEFDLLLTRLKDALEHEKQFTQDASHELRTPLMIMKSSLELLSQQAKRLTPNQQEKLRVMQDALKRMQALVEDLLFLSRGMSRKTREEMSVAHVTSDLLAHFQPIAEEKHLALVLRKESDPHLRTSPLALEKVIGNLLKNAIRFTEKGSVTVTLGKNSLSVADTGIGIPQEHLSHIFERFYRADESRIHAEDGFGLGLAICKAICEQEGWAIALESVAGKGSIFTISFA
jgi:signal transduction histidine kinase